MCERLFGPSVSSHDKALMLSTNSLVRGSFFDVNPDRSVEHPHVQNVLKRWFTGVLTSRTLNQYMISRRTSMGPHLSLLWIIERNVIWDRHLQPHQSTVLTFSQRTQSFNTFAWIPVPGPLMVPGVNCDSP